MTVATSAARTDGVLVLAARDGDRSAWDELVDRYGPLLWATARRHGLSRDDAAEVVRASWLRCVERLDRPDSDAIAAWLVTVCRRESVAALRRSGAAGDPPLPRLAEVVLDLEERILLRAGRRPDR